MASGESHITKPFPGGLLSSSKEGSNAFRRFIADRSNVEGSDRAHCNLGLTVLISHDRLRAPGIIVSKPEGKREVSLAESR